MHSILCVCYFLFSLDIILIDIYNRNNPIIFHSCEHLTYKMQLLNVVNWDKIFFLKIKKDGMCVCTVDTENT